MASSTSPWLNLTLSFCPTHHPHPVRPATAAFLSSPSPSLSNSIFSGSRIRPGPGSSSPTAVSAVGDVSSDGTTYLIAGAAAVALFGTAFPILFSRKDTCPECDGAGFIRKAGATLRANAARKDQAQIVCPRCSGLGKLGQIDK